MENSDNQRRMISATAQPLFFTLPVNPILLRELTRITERAQEIGTKRTYNRRKGNAKN